MPVSTVAAFWAVSFLFVLTPGADWAYAITAGLQHRTVLPAVGGLLAGHLLMTVVVAAGIGALLARSPGGVAAMTVMGAAYLVWLGGRMATQPSAPQVSAEQTSDSWRRQVATGFGVSGLNPKVLQLFLALLPQFVGTDASWPVPAQIVTLGLVHVASCTVIYTASR
jgi:threonine/homoserine/homoserine lactone efflux protein